MISKKHKGILELKTRKLVETLMVGNYKTNFKNSGIEFADFREYQSGDDAKNIDFTTSSKVGKTLIKLYEEERELDVYFLPFFGEEIDFIYNNIYKRDILEEIIYILGIAIVKEQNKFGSLYYNNGEKKIFPLGKGLAHFYNYFSKIENNNYRSRQNIIKKLLQQKEDNISQKLGAFNKLSIQNSLVFLFTSDTDIDEKELKIAALKNDLVICNIFHSFENNLQDSGVIGLGNNNTEIYIDLDDENKKREFRKKRKEKLINFRKKVRKTGANYLYFDEKVNIFAELYTFFKTR